MHKSKMAKSAVVVSIAATMALSGAPAWAASTSGTGSAAGNVAVSTGFPDVTGAHWAIKHVSKLSSLGIIQGYDGKFFPEEKVSQQDALIMAIRMMGLEEKALSVNASTYVLPFDVRDDAKPYVIQALQSGLITIQEETGDASQADKTWGARSASREWIAKIVVRMLNKQEAADKLQQTATSFKDNSAISQWAVGYINEAVAMKLVDGFEDGSFQPKGSVTRAQMATFLSRAAKDMPSQDGKFAIGYINQLGDKQIQLSDAMGIKSSFGIGANTIIYGVNSDTVPIRQSDLKVGAQVYVTVQGTNAPFIEVLREDAGFETAEGILDDVNVSELKVKVITDTGSAWYDLAATPTVLNKDGSGSSLGSLVKGSKVSLRRLGYPAGSKFSQVTVLAPPTIKNTDGTVQTVSVSDGKLTIAEKDAGTIQYRLAEGAVITWKGTAKADLSKLQQGDRIHYETLNDAITSLNVVKPFAETFDQGKLDYVKADSNTPYLTMLKADGKPSTYYVPANVAVTIPGLSYASLKDLKVGDDLKVALDDNNTITSITVTSRSISTTLMASFVSYDVDTKSITVVVNGHPEAYVLNENTFIDKGGNAVTVANFANQFSKGNKIDLVVSQGDKSVLKIMLASSYEGTITQINAATGDLTLKTDDGQYLPLKLAASPTIEIANVTNPVAANLAVDDKVRVTLSVGQDRVVTVQQKKVRLLRVLSKDTNGRILTFRDDSGSSYTYTIYYDTPIVSTSKTSLNFADIPVDEWLHATMIGNRITNIALQTTVRGKITAIDEAGGKLTVQDAAGAKSTVDTTGKIVVKRGSTINSTITSLKADDRVELVMNPGGGFSASVADVQQRTVSSFDAYSQTLSLLRRTLDDQLTYSLHPKVFVHKGDTVVSPNFLLPQEQVTVYLIDGKIIEIERK